MRTTWHGTWGDDVDAPGYGAVGVRHDHGYGLFGFRESARNSVSDDLAYAPPRSRTSRSHRSPETLVAFVGPIRVTTRRVYTPLRTLPVREVSWSLRNRFAPREETPEWALITALVGVPFTLGLSLLMLLVKETRLDGYVEIGVTHASGRYDVRLPVRSSFEVAALYQGVACARQWSPRSWSGRAETSGAYRTRSGFRTAA